MIRFQLNGKVVMPKGFATRDDLMHIAKQIFIPLMQSGIDSGMDIGGGQFPEPENKIASTRKLRKRIFTKKGKIRESASKKIEKTGLMGFTKKVLIDTGKLRRAFWAKKRGKHTVLIILKKDRADIGKYLQNDGIRTRHGKKYYDFFGVSDGMEKDAIKYMTQRIEDACKKFNG